MIVIQKNNSTYEILDYKIIRECKKKSEDNVYQNDEITYIKKHVLLSSHDESLNNILIIKEYEYGGCEPILYDAYQIVLDVCGSVDNWNSICANLVNGSVLLHKKTNEPLSVDILTGVNLYNIEEYIEFINNISHKDNAKSRILINDKLISIS